MVFFYWLITALICAGLELGTPGLFWFLSFSIGSAVAALAAVGGLSFGWQLNLFLLGLAGGAWFLKFYSRYAIPKSHFRTNVSALVGKTGIVTQVILPHQAGQVNLNGEIWSARALSSGAIFPGTIIEVVSFSGCHLIVKITPK